MDVSIYHLCFRSVHQNGEVNLATISVSPRGKQRNHLTSISQRSNTGSEYDTLSAAYPSSPPAPPNPLGKWYSDALTPSSRYLYEDRRNEPSPQPNKELPSISFYGEAGDYRGPDQASEPQDNDGYEDILGSSAK